MFISQMVPHLQNQLGLKACDRTPHLIPTTTTVAEPIKWRWRPGHVTELIRLCCEISPDLWLGLLSPPIQYLISTSK
ncbi:unnamed protein product [Larinioides sclopetarius]|uniref:Uncharacterized protein n=1 Tax=Larinioides sclopetarius TaxID=280406 RepID=A0AAV1Z374_9ARAC